MSRSKRQRCSVSFPERLVTLHEQVDTSQHAPLNVHVLRFLGSQQIAAASKAMMDWCSLHGKRVLFHLDYGCSPKFSVPLKRIALVHVDRLRLGRDGGQGPKDRADVIATCVSAQQVLAAHCSLRGVGARLEEGLYPHLGVRQVRFRQCHLSVGDVTRLLRCAPELESADFLVEHLAGLGEELRAVAPSCPKLRAIDFTDCQLSAADAGEIFKCFIKLKVAHFQAMDLRGLKTSHLPVLRSVSILDCCLSREDVISLMCSCPCAESMKLCGNPMGCELDEVDGNESPTSPAISSQRITWPCMPQLRHADFRFCGLSSDDEGELRSRLHDSAQVEFRTQITTRPSDGGNGHVVFEDSSSESEDE